MEEKSYGWAGDSFPWEPDGLEVATSPSQGFRLVFEVSGSLLHPCCHFSTHTLDTFRGCMARYGFPDAMCLEAASSRLCPRSLLLVNETSTASRVANCPALAVLHYVHPQDSFLRRVESEIPRPNSSGFLPLRERRSIDFIVWWTLQASSVPGIWFQLILGIPADCQPSGWFFSAVSRCCSAPQFPCWREHCWDNPPAPAHQ